ncbi:Crp/Fnr family transcriptional regulator [Chloroflexi bacterium TSY]|nr:Crp/Fnr family transcriptional regulator [Chloroflexi bacterium TSY]
MQNEHSLDSKHRDTALTRRLDFLRTVTLFSELNDVELTTILNNLRPREYTRDEIIFRQGDESRELYLVFQGKVRIFKVSPSGNETSLVIFGQGDVIGEFAALDHEPRNATAKAIGKVTLLALSHDDWHQHLRMMPKLTLGLSKMLVQKLRWTASYAEAVAQFDAAGRLLHILLLYTAQYGHQDPDNPLRYTLDLALNQSDLASIVGARREWVNRILRDWRKRNLIEYAGGIITILNIEHVRAERDSRIEANQGGDW